MDQPSRRLERPDGIDRLWVKEIAISKFKAACLAVLEQVRKTGKPIRVTRFGKPFADVVPPSPPERPQQWLSAMAEHAVPKEDIGELASSDLVDWEVDG